MGIIEGEAFLSPELFDEAYQNAMHVLAGELARPHDEQLLPQFRREMEEVFLGLYTARHFPEEIDEPQKVDLIQRGLLLREPERRWTRTPGFARYVRRYDARF